MSELSILLDQNIPLEIKPWLQKEHPFWSIFHTTEENLATSSDPEIFQWAQQKGCLIITFDEDFADQRSFPVGQHFGIIRLHVWPTTVEETQNALLRLFQEIPEQALRLSLVIVERTRIRIRRTT